MKSKFYFAYGSNLNAKNWNERTGIPFSKAFEKCGTAYLPDERLVFTRRSAIPGGGVLDIVPSPGHIVAGAVYRIKTDAAIFVLDRKEGSPYCYQKVERIAFTENGKSVLVFTYKAVEQEEYIEPHTDYVKTVAEGLRSFGLPTECLFAAAKNKPMPFMIDSLFCRRIASVELPDGKTTLAWVYEYNKDVARLNQIKSGDWTKR